MRKYLYITIPLLLLAASVFFLPLVFKGEGRWGIFSFFLPPSEKGDRGGFNNSAEAAATRSGLVGWWTMDTNDMSTTGATLYDKSGQNNHGTVTGTTTSTGRINQSRSFNGTSDLINMGNVLDQTNNEFSVSIWLKYTDTAQHYIIDKYSGSAGYVFYNAASANLQFFLQKDSTNYIYRISSIPTDDNQWHHFVGIAKKSGANFTNPDVYVDGVLRNGTTVGAGTVSTLTNASSLHIGNASEGGQFFNGLLDDVRIYNRALSAAEVAQLYSSAKTAYTASAPKQATSTSAGRLVGWWTMDSNDINGTTLYDKSGQNNHGTGVNITSADLVTGKINQALDFNGSNEYISATNNTSITSTRTTISAWVKFPFPITANYPRVVDLQDGSYSAQIVWDKGAVSGNGWATKHSQFQSGANATQWGVTPLLNTWYHIVAVWDSVANTTNFYINGVSQTGSANTNVGEGAGRNKIFIGVRGDLVATTYANAVIDDVRIYNYALSAQEVANLYSSAKTKYIASAPKTGLIGWWTLDQNDIRYAGTATTTYDKSGKNNTGTFSIGTNTYGATSTPGKINQAIGFDGVDDYVSIATTGFPTGAFGAMSISMWAKPDIVAADKYIFHYGTCSANNQFSLLMNASTYTLSECQEDTNSTTTPQVGKWVNLVGVYDGTKKYLYVNGSLENALTESSVSVTDATAHIGAYEGSQNYFPGSIDDVRVYNRALSAAEVANLYQSAKKNYQ